MTSNGILNDDLTRFVNDLSSDSESESEADFRIDALVRRAIRPDSQMFLLPEVSRSDMQLAAEAKELYYGVVNTTPKLCHNLLRDIYRIYLSVVDQATGSIPLWFWLYNWIRYLAGVLFSSLTELSFAYQIIIQSMYQVMLGLDMLVTGIYDDRGDKLRPASMYDESESPTPPPKESTPMHKASSRDQSTKNSKKKAQSKVPQNSPKNSPRSPKESPRERVNQQRPKVRRNPATAWEVE